MNDQQLDRMAKRLEALHAEIMKVMAWKEGANESGEALDEIDQANELIEKEMGSLMSNNSRANLKEVEEAQHRLKDGNYGQCQHCGTEISIKRLELLPFAKYCVPCQEKLESHNR
jgi:DnaK suppressor protein